MTLRPGSTLCALNNGFCFSKSKPGSSEIGNGPVQRGSLYMGLTILHSERPKLCAMLAFLSAKRLEIH